MSKVTKTSVPEGFTVPLSIVDFIPVIFFGINAVIMGVLLGNISFVVGAVITFLSGFIKALWKLIVAIKKKNIYWMFIQMRVFMPIGFALMVLAFFLQDGVWARVYLGFMHMPSMIFFILGLSSMVGMMICAFKLDNGNPRNNWIEQGINSFSQICIFLGLIFLL